MGAGIHVGRVGSLAVALGIGAAVITGHGTALANPADTSGTGFSSTDSAAPSDTTDDGQTSDTADSDASTNDDTAEKDTAPTCAAAVQQALEGVEGTHGSCWATTSRRSR